MNKLIIIGNGFDLAHGLETSYDSFIRWFVTKRFREAFAPDNDMKNPILNVFIGRAVSMSNTSSVVSIEHLVELFLNGQFAFEKPAKTVNLPNGYVSIGGEIKSSLLEGLLSDHRDYNWVDIENHFYANLKNILRSQSSTNVKVVQQKLTKLNQELDDLKDELSKYLTEVRSKARVNNEYINFVEEEINPHAILEKHLLETEVDEYLSDGNNSSLIQPASVKFLDFNYTSLIRKLELEGDVGYIHIHGSLGNDNNPLIFGYGDEIDDTYLEMEKSNVNEYLKHIKSFGSFVHCPDDVTILPFFS